MNPAVSREQRHSQRDEGMFSSLHESSDSHRDCVMREGFHWQEAESCWQPSPAGLHRLGMVFATAGWPLRPGMEGGCDPHCAWALQDRMLRARAAVWAAGSSKRVVVSHQLTLGMCTGQTGELGLPWYHCFGSQDSAGPSLGKRFL